MMFKPNPYFKYERTFFKFVCRLFNGINWPYRSFIWTYRNMWNSLTCWHWRQVECVRVVSVVHRRIVPQIWFVSFVYFFNSHGQDVYCVYAIYIRSYTFYLVRSTFNRTFIFVFIFTYSRFIFTTIHLLIAKIISMLVKSDNIFQQNSKLSHKSIYFNQIVKLQLDSYSHL